MIFWFHVLSGKAETYQDSVGKITSLEEARKFEDEIGSRFNDYVLNLTEDDMKKMVKLPFGDERSSVSDICWHMVEEELQHRGEMNALLWQMNIDPPIGSYKDWEHAR